MQKSQHARFLFLATAGLLLTAVGCSVKMHARPQVIINVNATAALAAAAAVRTEARAQVAVPIHGALVVEFFGVPLDGVQDVVFVLDRSGSMSEPAQGRIAAIGAAGSETLVRSKIDVAREELTEALHGLPEGTRLNVIFFNDALEGYAPQALTLEATARDGLIGFVKDTTPSGSTALTPAMRTAFLMNARRVVLLSDGLGNIGGDSDDLLRDAREAMRGGVRIDTIGLGADQDTALLRNLATESGGIYQDLR